MTGILVFGIIAFLLGLVVFVVRHERRENRMRYAFMERFAKREGLDLQAQLPRVDQLPFANAQVISQHRSTGSVHNYMTGQRDGIELVLTDFHYYVNYGRNSTLFKISIAAFRLPHANIPAFAMAKENMFSRIAEFFGAQDIDFTKHADFSKNYRLYAGDEVAIRSFFTAELITAIESGLLPKPYLLQASDGWLIVHSDPAIVKLDDWQTFIDASYTLTQRINALTQAHTS
jgi:hypothetical protein